MSTSSNSFGMMSCIDNNVILHIPHSSINIPSWANYTIDPMNEINLLTDWGTDKIFNIQPYEQIVFPFNRVFCDVERFVENEPMEKLGMGFYYTHTDDGELLRTDIDKDSVLELYNTHHNTLTDKVESMLSEYGLCLIVDCHSFSDKPFNRDTNQQENRPDICIGTTSKNTDAELIQDYIDVFTSYGYSVEVNSPYEGSMIPLKYVGDERVQSIMIEVNRKLYMSDESTVIDSEIEKLNKVMSECIQPLYHK